MSLRPRWMKIGGGVLPLLAAAATLAAAGCGGGSSNGDGDGAAASTNEKVTLKLAIEATGGTGESPIMPVIRAFNEQHPSITINVAQTPAEQYAEVLRTQLRSGNGPDLLYGAAGTGATQAILPLAKAGLIADLSDRPWASQIPGKVKPLVQLDGKTYEVPLEFAVAGIIYNPGNYEKYGVEAPDTYADLVEACRTISGQGNALIALAGAVPTSPALLASMMANNYVYAQIPDWNEQRAAGKTTFASTPGWKTTVERFEQLAKAGCFQKGAAAAGFPQQGQLIGSQKASGAPAPLLALKTIRDSGVTFPLSAFAVPADSADATRLTASPNYGFAAAAQSKHLDAAKQFLDFLASDEGARIWAQARGDVSYADAMAGKIPKEFAPVEPYLEDGRYLPMPSLGWNPGAFEALGKNLTGLLTGQVSPDQVLQAVDQAWDAAG